MSLPDPSHVVVSRRRFSNLDFLREVLVAIRFGAVGIFATVVHITVVWLLLRQAEMTPIPANTLAFLTAFGISFVGNYVWTFRSPGSPRRAIVRFFLIAVGAYAANTIFIAFLVSARWLSTLESTIIAASIVPIISFTASRLWCFNQTFKSE